MALEKSTKPYTIDELEKVMNERNHAKAVLEAKRREIRVEKGKLESLEADEARLFQRLEDLEEKVIVMTANLIKSAK